MQIHHFDFLHSVVAHFMMVTTSDLEDVTDWRCVTRKMCLSLGAVQCCREGALWGGVARPLPRRGCGCQDLLIPR